MRIGIVGLLHESNTFIQRNTTYADFEQGGVHLGDDVRRAYADSHHELGGFLTALAAHSAEVETAPLFAARALPSGTVAADAYEQLVDALLGELAGTGSLDGLLAAPHGATVSEEFPDADGEWLRRVRSAVGPELPIVGTLDAHGNLSPQMVDQCNALIAYRSNPHLDQKQRGMEAAELLIKTIRGEVAPTMSAAFPPVSINIERQLTTELPCRELYELADEQLGNPRLLSNSILLGFPYADVREMGSAVIAVTDGDPDLARRLSGELAARMWQRRESFVGEFIDIERALDECAGEEGPVCLLDMGDNVGGGSPADATFLAQAIHRRQIGPAFVCLADSESVVAAQAAGVAARVKLQVGGKTDDRHGDPLESDFTVVSLHDGKFSETEPRHGGFTQFDQGPTAIVRTDTDLVVMLTSRRMVPFSIHQLTSCGLEPSQFRILVAKGVHAPTAAYRPVSRRLIRVDTPGSTTANMLSLQYHHRRQPLFPFEQNCDWAAER